MTETGKSMVLEKPEEIRMHEFELPRIGNNEGLVKMELVGVCGSDPSIFHGSPSRVPRPYPIIMGHELLGRIHEIGENASKRWGVKEGDRVVIESSVGCGLCKACIQGDYRLCEKAVKYGMYVSCKDPPHFWGGYGEYLYLSPFSKVCKISEEIPAEAGLMSVANLGNTLRWLVHIGKATVGETVIIQGPGPQGLSAIIAAREAGAEKIIVTGLAKDRERLELAREFGADHTINVEEENLTDKVKELTNGKMADIVLNVTGDYNSPKTDLEIVKKKGRIILAGQSGLKQETPLILDRIVLNELNVRGVYSEDIASVEAAVKVIESQKYPIEKMVTHKLPFNEAEKGIALVERKIKGEKPIKVVLDTNKLKE
jgi:alcohol dehydrogenase